MDPYPDACLHMVEQMHLKLLIVHTAKSHAVQSPYVKVHSTIGLQLQTATTPAPSYRSVQCIYRSHMIYRSHCTVYMCAGQVATRKHLQIFDCKIFGSSIQHLKLYTWPALAGSSKALYFDVPQVRLPIIHISQRYVQNASGIPAENANLADPSQ